MTSSSSTKSASKSASKSKSESATVTASDDSHSHSKPPSQSESHSKSHSEPQPQPHYEFNGPSGAFLITFILPLVCYFLYFSCNRRICLSIDPNSPHFLAIENPLEYTSFNHLFTWRATGLYISWFILQIILYYILPGDIIKGIKLDSIGNQLNYPINGFSSLIVSVFIIIGLVYSDLLSSTIGYEEFIPLLSISIVFSYILSIWLYIRSIQSNPYNIKNSSHPELYLAPHGNTGNRIYDFFIGRTLNPRIGELDLKYFCELRPGLIGWMLLIWSFACQQYKENLLLNSNDITNNTNCFGITNSMILILIFQSIYVIDALTSESAILTTMDITTDGFGFMLVFGDLVWVPFTYSLQARYLVEFPIHLSNIHLFFVLLICSIGFIIFRGSNNQKNEFRSNPNSSYSRSMKYIQTSTGSKLLISGFWGYSRHFNYFGDILMGLSWCLPCGFNSPIPYFYTIYFTILLIHRERRDDEKCKNKYGQDWIKYCEIVKYRIIPYIY